MTYAANLERFLLEVQQEKPKMPFDFFASGSTFDSLSLERGSRRAVVPGRKKKAKKVVPLAAPKVPEQLRTIRLADHVQEVCAPNQRECGEVQIQTSIDSSMAALASLLPPPPGLFLPPGLERSPMLSRQLTPPPGLEMQGIVTDLPTNMAEVSSSSKLLLDAIFVELNNRAHAIKKVTDDASSSEDGDSTAAPSCSCSTLACRTVDSLPEL